MRIAVGEKCLHRKCCKQTPLNGRAPVNPGPPPTPTPARALGTHAGDAGRTAGGHVWARPAPHSPVPPLRTVQVESPSLRPLALANQPQSHCLSISPRASERAGCRLPLGAWLRNCSCGCRGQNHLGEERVCREGPTLERGKNCLLPFFGHLNARLSG